jgi:hypothetical protein
MHYTYLFETTILVKLLAKFWNKTKRLCTLDRRPRTKGNWHEEHFRGGIKQGKV